MSTVSAPNYRHLDIDCCLACKYGGPADNGDFRCTYNRPSPEMAALAGYPRPATSIPVDPLGVCDAYECAYSWHWTGRGPSAEEDDQTQQIPN